MVHIPLVQAGDRHVFICISARFSAGPEGATDGIPVVDGLALAEGSDRQNDSAVYSIDANGKSVRPMIER